MEAFACVIEHKSSERAASPLNITGGAISQRIKSLENSLSTILIIRERPIHPTSTGQVLLQHVSALRSLEHDVLKLLSHKSSMSSKVAIGVHPDSLNTWFAPLLIELMRAEQVCVEIISDDRCSSLNILKRGDVQGCVSVVADALDGFEVHPLAIAHAFVSCSGSRSRDFLVTMCRHYPWFRMLYWPASATH
ncbi:LysR family transcriptional regulator [Pseudomonas veronii]